MTSRRNKSESFKYGSLIKLQKKYIDILTQCIKKKQVKDVKYYKQFLSNSVFVYLGEIPQMSGHIICAGKDGKVYFGFHDDDFQELTEEEL